MAVADHALSLSAQTGAYLGTGGWQVGVGYRWEHSDRIYQGSKDVTPSGFSPLSDDIHFIDVFTSYGLTKRLSLNLDLPFIYAERTSLVENEFHERTATVGGLGDIRLDGNFWLLNPDKHPNGNIALGLGVKAPTGQDDATDLFYRSGALVRRPVHVSIQPGDGGWGIILELQAFQKISERAIAYISGSYLINPRNENGVEITIADDDPVDTAAFGKINSVPDQYVGRIGLGYLLWPKYGLSVTLGGRVEGIPVYDLIGGSDGYRASGYAVSIEPGLAVNVGKATLTVSAPVAVDRNRQASVPNLAAGTVGFASFADFLILANLSYRF